MDIAQQVARFTDRRHDHAPWIQLETEHLREECSHRSEPIPGFPAIIGEQQNVVHVAEVVPHSQLLLHEVVERVEVDVGEELAREAPDRHAATGLVGAVGDQRFEHGQETRVRDPAAQPLEEHRVVDAREVAPDVDLHAIPPPGPGAHEGLVALDRAVGPAARDAGVAVGDEAVPEDRVQHVEERVMYDTVAEWRGTDLPPFRIAHPEAMKRTPRICPTHQRVTDLPQPGFEMLLELPHLAPFALAVAGPDERATQVAEVDDRRKEILLTLHVAPRKAAGPAVDRLLARPASLRY